MAINQTHLLKLAKELLESGDEVRHRASASRSFYAAFHLVKPLFDELHHGPELVVGIHQEIIDFFESYKGPFGKAFSAKIYQIGVAYSGLRILRTHADYKKEEAFTKVQAEMAYKSANKFVALVAEAHALKNKDST